MSRPCRCGVRVAAVALTVAACGRARPTLFNVTVEPDAISPNQDGVRDVARLSYSVGAAAEVSITLRARGEDYVFRAGLPRQPDDYEALFGGVVDGRMLPDGRYTVAFEARPVDSGPPVVVERTLDLQGGDTEPPRLEGLSLQPDLLTPNQDGIADEVHLSYRLDEAAQVRVFLADADGARVTDILEQEESATMAGEPGPHEYEYDAGVEADARPPDDGDYTIVVEARDAAGNVIAGRLPLRIREGGQPRAAMFGDVDWSSTVVPLGTTLHFTVTVRNVGKTPIRTRGPEPGFVYDNAASFNQAPAAAFLVLARRDGRGTAEAVGPDGASPDLDLGAPGPSLAAEYQGMAQEDLGPVGRAERVDVCGRVTDAGAAVAGAEVTVFEIDGDGLGQTTTGDDGRWCLKDVPVPDEGQRSFARSPGAIRLGLEYDEKQTDLAYPYRWQLGRTADLDVCTSANRIYLCLAPGKEVVVTGGVQFTAAPFRRSTNVYLALMHEDVRKLHGPYGVQRITVEH